MKGGSGPSGLDADGWRRILISSVYGTATTDLRCAIAEFIKKLCTVTLQEDDVDTIQSFTACRLIPLNKNPGLRPIGVGEVLRRIAGKVLMHISKDSVSEAEGSLQLCAGQESGAEAAIHAMHDIFADNDTEAVLLIDAENAFNSINRKVMLHNISVLCPIISIYITNCYSSPARLFITGGGEIKSLEGTTQGDPTAMAAYALAVTPLLSYLSQENNRNQRQTKQVAFADDFTVAGKINEIRMFWEALAKIGPKYGYYPKASKSYLIVKVEHDQKAHETFNDLDVKITTTGQRHLGAVIGSLQYKNEYVMKLVNSWTDQLHILSKIAEIDPQAAYSAFINGFRSKLTYFIRTIPEINELLRPLEDIMRNEFIPAITGGIVCSNDERKLLSLPPRLGGMGLTVFSDECDLEYNNSRNITASLRKSIVEQSSQYSAERKTSTKNKIKSNREKRQKDILESIRSSMNEKQLRLNDNNTEKGVSNWLTVLPIKHHGFDLNKQEFWDGIRLRYGWNLLNLPTVCACGTKFDLQHAMNCKKGGFINIRHNNVRDLTSNMLSEVCKDVTSEPLLLPLTGEEFERKSTKTANESRLDIKARGFWLKGQNAFFDIRVFDPNALRYFNINLQKSYSRNEMEKKRHYNDRVLEVENGSFTPLVFSIYSGMVRECQTFYHRLAEMIAEKQNAKLPIVISWLRTKICFSLLKSCLFCIRGSRRSSDNSNQMHAGDLTLILRSITRCQ